MDLHFSHPWEPNRYGSNDALCQALVELITGAPYDQPTPD